MAAKLDGKIVRDAKHRGTRVTVTFALASKTAAKADERATS